MRPLLFLGYLFEKMLPIEEMLKMLKIERAYPQKNVSHWGNVKSFLGLDPPFLGFIFLKKCFPLGTC